MTSPLHGNRLELVVLGDWGRDAGIRFCATVSQLERERILSELPGGAAFFDEYRRIAMTLVGDVYWAKAPWLEERELLDETILVGFPGGLTVEQVVPRLLALALGGMAGPVARGAREVVLALPCNTLAPAAWAIAAALSTPETIEATLESAQVVVDDAARVAVRALSDGLRVSVPTVPEAVVEGLDDGVDSVLPVGTTGIPELYRRAVARGDGSVSVVEPTDEWRQTALLAINAAVAGERAAGHDALARIYREARAAHGDSLVMVEACTDLDFGVGLDSNRAFARSIVEIAYA